MLLVFGLTSAAGFAQRYKKGDEIEVFFLNNWAPAVVVDTNNRGEVLAEYEFAGRTQQDGFGQEQVRSTVSLQEKESVQGQIDSCQKPNVQFYETVEIPAKILDPSKQDGPGTTRVTNQGLVSD
jgi:hypothetical protein